MCGRYSLALGDPAGLRARFPLGEAVELRRRFNIAPSDEVVAVTTTRDGAPRGELLRWGLVPHWSRDPRTGVKAINARVETLAERPAFRDALRRFRCLIPADGFYEWHRGPDGRKQAFHITRADGEPFAFAGLWARWKPPTEGGEGEIRSCTIITRPANDALAPIHDRMPVILDPDREQAWLDPEAPGELLAGALVGIPADALELRPVGSAVNDVRYDGPDCIAPVALSSMASGAGARPAPTPAQPSLF